MARLIKRYGSRKLYDTGESSYISLEDVAGIIRSGEEIQVVDNASGEDVTTQTLAQVISEEGRKGSTFLSNEHLHEIIRVGGGVLSKKVKQLQDGVDSFVKKSFDRIVPVRMVREEMATLRQRLDELESSLSKVEEQKAKPSSAPEEAVPQKAPARKTTRKTTSKKSTAGTKTAGTGKKAATTKAATPPKTTTTQAKESNSDQN